jgi:hypothetical protein
VTTSAPRGQNAAPGSTTGPGRPGSMLATAPVHRDRPPRTHPEQDHGSTPMSMVVTWLMKTHSAQSPNRVRAVTSSGFPTTAPPSICCRTSSTTPTSADCVGCWPSSPRVHPDTPSGGHRRRRRAPLRPASLGNAAGRSLHRGEEDGAGRSSRSARSGRSASEQGDRAGHERRPGPSRARRRASVSVWTRSFPAGHNLSRRRAKQGLKRSVASDGQGIPPHLIAAGANDHDSPLPSPPWPGSAT